MKLTWNREDTVSSDEEFAKMVSAVSRFVYYNCGTNQEDALVKVAAVRSKENLLLGMILDQLYDCILDCKEEKARILLDDAIRENADSEIF